MADQTSTDDLVTETSAMSGTAGKAPGELKLDRAVVDPAAALDPATHADPAKVKQPAPAKPKRQRAPTKAARAVKRDIASNAAAVKRMAEGRARKAAASHAAASADELRAAYEAAKLNEVKSFDDLPENGKLQLRLADDGHFVDGAIDVDRASFAPGAQGMTYSKPIDIGPDCGPVRVVEVWVVAASGEAVCCPVGPLSGGGGHHAQIPDGHLKF